MKYIILLLSAIAMVSCGKTSFNAQLGQAFEMQANHIVKIDETDLKIKGFKIDTDSRCPEGANCFWQGEVVAEFNLDDILIKVGSDKGLDTLGYHFTIVSIKPEREVDGEISRADYLLEILISK